MRRWWQGLAAAAAVATASPSAQAECTERWNRARLDEQLSRAESALSGDDARAQKNAVKPLLDAIPCVSEVVTPAQAARVHRVVGLYHAITRNDRHVARFAFAGARAASGSAAPPPSIPSALHGTWGEVDIASARWEDLPTNAATGAWWVNGEQQGERPRQYPVLVQAKSSGGGVCTSAYLWNEDDAEPCRSAASGGGGGGRRGLKRTAQLVSLGGAAALVTGSSMYVGAWVRSGQYRDAAGNPTYTEDYARGVLRPWAATGGVLALVGAGALGGGLAWASTDAGQMPVFQLRGTW